MRFIPSRTEKDDNTHSVELLAASSVQAIKDPSNTTSAKSSGLWHKRLYVGLKSLGLSVFIAWRRRPETKKVAIYKNRRTAAIRCLIHLVPLSVALTLLGLNFSQQFLSISIPSQIPAALQFAAKLHEITITASLATVMLAIICHYLTRPSGLPFGAAFGHLQAQLLTYLISPELLGTIRSSQHTWRFRYGLVLVLSIFPVLMATVGPASAACMIPRYHDWLSASSHIYIDASIDDVFPTDQLATAYEHERDTNGLLLGEDYLALNYALRNVSHATFVPSPATGSWLNKQLTWDFPILNDTYQSDSIEEDDKKYGVVTSLQSIAIRRDILGKMQSDALQFIILPSSSIEVHGAMHAVSEVQCDEGVEFDTSTPAPVLNFSGSLGQPQSSGRLDPKDVERIRKWSVSNDVGQNFVEDLFFVERPESKGFGAVRAATYYDPISDGASTELTPCSFRLQWVPAVYRIWVNGESSWTSDQQHRIGTRTAIPSLDWLHYVNPPGVNGSSAFACLNSGLYEPATTISTLLVVALSRTTRAPAEFYPPGQTPISHGLRIRQDNIVRGYGWGAESLTIQVSLAILLAYCLVAVGHIVYSLWTGISSTAWDSISEALALALNSPRPKEMANTDAGIRTAQVFEHRVQIAAIANSDQVSEPEDMGMEKGGDMLALLFPSDEGLVVSSVRANTEYGRSME